MLQARRAGLARDAAATEAVQARIGAAKARCFEEARRMAAA
jgi:hypothetical protein